MKLVVVFIYLLVFEIGFSQPYKPLLDNTNQWNFTTCNFGCTSDAYYTNGDTIVAGLNYKILDGFHYISRTFLLREEINNKKVFLAKINPTTVSERILYDFSLTEGAVFTMNNVLSPFPSNGGEFVLDSIRSKPLLNNVYFKHFFFSPIATNETANYNVVWIEGLGSKSLINAPGGNEDINGVGALTCFFKNQELVYSNLQSNQICTYLELKTEKQKQLVDKIKIYSLPEKNKFSFLNSEFISKITIYDCFGKNLNYLFENKNQFKFIDLSNNSKGIYFVNVLDSLNKKTTFKVLVQ